MFGLLDGVEELSEVDKNGNAALVNSPFFFFLCRSLFALKRTFCEINICFQVIRFQLMIGLVELLN